MFILCVQSSKNWVLCGFVNAATVCGELAHGEVCIESWTVYKTAFNRLLKSVF